MGCFLLIVFYAVLGFGYAWVVGIVAREEIPVGRGVLVVLLTSILGGLALLGVQMLELGPFVGLPGSFAIHFLGFWLLGMALTKIPKKESAIIAAIYAVILLGAYLLVSLAFADAGTLEPR